MRIRLRNNIKVIQKYYKKRLVCLSKNDRNSIRLEYKEWVENEFDDHIEIWSLPDLTRSERLDNFCRSIKKKMN